MTYSIVRSLIELGAQINGHFDEEGKHEIPLLVSVRYGQKQIASLLLANGANLLQCDQDGNNALHIAASFGREEFIDILSEPCLHGSNDSGLTPIDIAFQSRFFEMAETLKSSHCVDGNSNSTTNTTPQKEDECINDPFFVYKTQCEGSSVDELSLEDSLDVDDYNSKKQGETISSLSKQDFMIDLQIENRRLNLSLKEMEFVTNNAKKAIEILENKCCRFQAEVVSLQHEINQMNGNDIHNKSLDHLIVLEHKLRAALDKVVREKDTIKSEQVIDEGRVCVICHEEQKSVLFLPCRHLCVCRQCSDIEQVTKCPLCRHAIEEKLHVYS